MTVRVEPVDPLAQAAWDEVGQRSFCRDEAGYGYGDILSMDPGVLHVAAGTADTWLLAFEDARPVGRLYLEEIPQESGNYASVLRDIAVLPEARRRGVGRALVAAALARMKSGTGALGIETDVEDIALHGLLSRTGFVLNPEWGYGAWVLMDYPYKAKALERVEAVRRAGIEIRPATMTDSVELTRAVWGQPFRKWQGRVPASVFEQTRRFLECGGRTFFAWQADKQVGTVMGIPRANTATAGRFYRDPLAGVLTWIESFPDAKKSGLATALVYALMESFRSDGSRFFFYRGFGYGVPSHRVGMGMGHGYLRGLRSWSLTR